MNYTASLQFKSKFLSNSDLYDLFKSEDLDFQGKNITITINKIENGINCDIICSSLHELKIATTALINSMTTIEKTINVVQ